MIQKNYLKYLKSKCKKFGNRKEIFDIVLYGSSVKGKQEVTDLDLLLIFKDKKLKDRAELAQDLKENLDMEKVDLKTINLIELFDNEFLARKGVFVEGISLLDDITFSKKIGFEGFSLFSYNLKNLNHNEKTKFTYALIGRGSSSGVVRDLDSKSLGKGVVRVPIRNSLRFEEFLKRWNVNYKKEDILS